MVADGLAIKEYIHGKWTLPAGMIHSSKYHIITTHVCDPATPQGYAQVYVPNM